VDKIYGTEWTKSMGQKMIGKNQYDRVDKIYGAEWTKSMGQIGQNQWDKKCKNQWDKILVYKLL